MVDILVERSSAEERIENIDEAKIAEVALFESGKEWVCSYTISVVLVVMALAISIGIAYFVCSRCYLQ